MALRRSGQRRKLSPVPNTVPKNGPRANRSTAKPVKPVKPAAKAPSVPAPARAAAAAGRGANAAGSLVNKGVKAVKGSGIIKGVSTSTGVGATVGRTASKLLGPALIGADAIERSNRGQNFVQRAIPTAGVSGAAGWAGARAGSVSGAKLGSMLGPKGALIGGVLGGAAGGLVGYGTGGAAMDSIYEANSKGSKNKPKPQLTPTQNAAAARLGQAQPKDVGNKAQGTARAGRPVSTAQRNQNGGYASRFAGAREANLDRINNDPRFAAPQARLVSPAIGAPVHASPAAFGSAPKLASSPYVGSSAASPSRPSTPGQAVIAASESYRDGGKGLYQGSEAYRKAVGGSGNPLLNRFRQDMGLDPETGDRLEQLAPQELPAENPYAGIGDLRGLQINDTQPRIPQNAEVSAQKTNPQYQGNDEPGKLGQAEDPLRALAELLFKNKLKISVN